MTTVVKKFDLEIIVYKNNNNITYFNVNVILCTLLIFFVKSQVSFDIKNNLEVNYFN